MNVYLLYPRSSFPDSKERYPDLPFKNGGVAGAIELKRPVSAHCHGARALAREDGVDKLMAKKKLYIASAVCLVFMIGEVIGKNLKENRRSDICILFFRGSEIFGPTAGPHPHTVQKMARKVRKPICGKTVERASNNFKQLSAFKSPRFQIHRRKICF